MDLPLNLLAGDVPIVDGTVLPAPVAEVFEAGEEAPVPFLVGTTDLEVPDFFVQQTGRDPASARAAIVGDDEARCRGGVRRPGGARPAPDLRRAVHRAGPAPRRRCTRPTRPTYLYRFSITSPDLQRLLGGAPHASEIPFVFDDSSRPAVPGRGGRALADTISDYWVAFATTGRPTHDGAPAWPAYDRRRRLMELTTTPGPRAGPVDPAAGRVERGSTLGSMAGSPIGAGWLPD